MLVFDHMSQDMYIYIYISIYIYSYIYICTCTQCARIPSHKTCRRIPPPPAQPWAAMRLDSIDGRGPRFWSSGARRQSRGWQVFFRGATRRSFSPPFFFFGAYLWSRKSTSGCSGYRGSNSDKFRGFCFFFEIADDLGGFWRL